MPLALGIAACSPAADTGIPSTTTTEPRTGTTAPTTTVPLVAGCPEGGEFTEGGAVGEIDQVSSDADTIGLITWAAEESCETFTFAFETSEGAPATTPPAISITYLEHVPVLRVSMDASKSVITDQLIETAMVDRLYVVRALDGGMFVDIHLATPAQARFEVGSSPARLNIDLQPGIVDYPSIAAAAKNVVVVSPVDGQRTDPAVLVEGYARTFEANVLLIGTAGGDVVAETSTTAADSEITWGEFRAEIDLPPGPVAIFAGDESAEDGSLEGVTINIVVG